MSPTCDDSLKNLPFTVPILLVWALMSGSFILWNQEARVWVTTINILHFLILVLSNTWSYDLFCFLSDFDQIFLTQMFYSYRSCGCFCSCMLPCLSLCTYSFWFFSTPLTPALQRQKTRKLSRAQTLIRKKIQINSDKCVLVIFSTSGAFLDWE